LIRDPGWVKIQDPDPGSGSRMENHFFFVKIPKFCDEDPGSRIWDGKNLDPGSRIWDKHPGSAKLEISSPNLLGLKEPSNNRTLCGKGILG